MGIINEIINDFQKEKLNAQYLKDYDYDFTDGKWNWPMLNAEIDLFQGVTSWARDLVIGVVWLINPFHWDDAIEGVGYSVTHISEVVPAIMDEVKTTYEEQGLVYCVGYVIPEVLSYFYGAGEAKAVSKLEKVDDITKLGKYADDALGAKKYTQKSPFPNGRVSKSIYEKYCSTYDNPKWFDQETGEVNWPYEETHGALPESVRIETLEPGTIIDRYGNEDGNYTSPDGTSVEARSLIPASRDDEYHRYVVNENIEVEAGEVAPWFDEPGGGTQYYTEMTIGELLKKDYIEEIK